MNNLVAKETTMYVQNIANMIHHFCLTNRLFISMYYAFGVAAISSDNTLLQLGTL